jgi:hypothetical protein
MISTAPRSNSASTEASSTTSSADAWFEGTSRPSSPTCTSICEVEKPRAPSRMDCRTSSFMAAISSGVAERSDASSPITKRRTAQ